MSKKRRKLERDLKENPTILASVSSIITSMIAILTVSNVRLTCWWHFIVAFICLVVSYLCLWALLLLCVKLFYRRKPVEGDIDKNFHISEITRAAQELYEIKNKFDHEPNLTAKEMLRGNVIYKCRQLEEKIKTVSDLSDPSYKDDVVIEISDKLLENYTKYVKDVQAVVNPQNFVI